MFVHNAAISHALLLFHAVIQPYENRCINMLDLFMYTNIILISLISLYNYIVLYAFYHSGVIIPQHFTSRFSSSMLQWLHHRMDYLQLGTPSESTLGAKT